MSNDRFTAKPQAPGANVGALLQSSARSHVAVIVMGPSGCGKTTMGRRLAQALGAEFVDGDDHHPQQNVKKMSAGLGLTDEDRAPWLQRLRQIIQDTPRIVLACSALRRSYRNELRQAAPKITFIYLRVPEDELTRRLTERTGHYAGARLLSSQLAALEEPHDETDAFTLDGRTSEDELLATMVALVLPYK